MLKGYFHQMRPFIKKIIDNNFHLSHHMNIHILIETVYMCLNVRRL